MVQRAWLRWGCGVTAEQPGPWGTLGMADLSQSLLHCVNKRHVLGLAEVGAARDREDLRVGEVARAPHGCRSQTAARPTLELSASLSQTSFCLVLGFVAPLEFLKEHKPSGHTRLVLGPSSVKWEYAPPGSSQIRRPCTRWSLQQQILRPLSLCYWCLSKSSCFQKVNFSHKQ